MIERWSIYHGNMLCERLGAASVVMRGLDPHIPPFERKMDRRVPTPPRELSLIG
jgi:hypothetical protein